MVDPFKNKQLAGWPKQKCSSIKPVTQNKVTFSELYDYGDATTFQTKVDNSLAGQMRDCGECHVGGGGMEYVMAAKGADLSSVSRLSLRDLGTGSYAYTVVGTCDDRLSTCAETDDTGVGPVTASNFTSVNYFIDQFDEDNDTFLGEVLHNDYSQTGVLEMDCLMCHMEGYSWNDRKEAVRLGNFDSSRSAGAGLGTVATGTTVNYDFAADGSAPIVDDGVADLELGPLVLDAIKAAPPNANCSSCHFDMHQVDWKKRGTSWNENMAYETEVHASIGCMGCHERTDGMTMDPNNSHLGNFGENLTWTGNAKTKPGILGHDPSKQFAPYSSLWNTTDATGGAKTCESCHTDQIASNFGAADPTQRHEELGLLTLIAQDGRDGVPDATHLDIIACDACHTRKLGHGPAINETDSHTHGSLYEWGTGGALVDSTGADADGRVTDHENLYVERTMESNLVRGWSGGKLSSRHALVTMFWRDKHDKFNYGNVGTYVDINADGQDGAMDAVNPSHVRDAMVAAGLDVLTHDGVIDSAEIAAQRTAIMQYLPSVNIDPTGAKLKMSFMGVLFRANHGTSPASQAWGANGCADCHADGAGFYNGSYDLAPRDLDVSWDNFVPNAAAKTFDNSAVGGGKPKWNYVVPFTKVNKDNYSGRDFTLPICSTYYGPSPRPALPVMGDLTAGSGTEPGDPCTNPDTGAVGTWTVYPKGDIKADWQFTDFHPTLWAKGLTSRSIAASAALGTAGTIRTIDRSELIYAKSEVVPAGDAPGARTMVDGTVATGRSGIVASLNAIGGSYNAGAHATHLREAGASDLATCVDCHLGAASADFSLDTDNSVNPTTFNGEEYTATPLTIGGGDLECLGKLWMNPADNAGDPADVNSPVYTCVNNLEEKLDIGFTANPGTPTGTYTCVTVCHPDTSAANEEANIGTSNSATNGAATAHLSALHSNSDNQTITFNAQRSNCDDDCVFSFDISACNGTIVGGNGSDVIVVKTDDLTNCTVDVDVTDSGTSDVATATVAVTPVDTIDEVFAGNIGVQDNGNGTCTVTSSDAATNGARLVTIYWGDRSRTVVSDPATELAGTGITHSCGSEVRVQVTEQTGDLTDRVVTNLTF